jgi:hypothetical protein
VPDSLAAPGAAVVYAARICDLQAGDFVTVECGHDGHDGLIHPAALPSLRLGPDERVVDLAPRLRCDAAAAMRRGRQRCRSGGEGGPLAETALPRRRPPEVARTKKFVTYGRSQA